MKKYLLSLITLTFFLCEASFIGGGMAFAADFGTNLTYTISSNTLTISVKSGYTTGSMPYWTSSNYTNATTGRPWESSKTTITTVIINKGVKNIGSYAFRDFSALTTVKFGTSTSDTCSIDSVGTYAFYNCAKVATVYCYGSTSTYAMRNWLNIGFNGSYANPYSTSTVKGSSKKFYMNSSSTTTLTTSNLSKATKIKPYAFYKHSQLTSVTLPSTVKSIGNYAFAYDSLLNTVKFGSGSTDQCGIDTIMGSAFATCVTLATVYCYGGIEKWLHIGFNAGAANPLGAYTGSGTKKFYLDGTSITTLTIPEGVSKIKGYAFYKHTQFTKISIPSTVTYVGAYALAYCTGLTDLVALPTTPPSTESSTFNNITPANINLYVASTASATYGSATRWSAFTKRYSTLEGECGASGNNITFELNFAEHSLTLTGSGAMATYSTSTKAPWYTFKDDINTITIGSGITGIGAYAFKDCANATSASIPASITSVGSSAFDGCKAMTSYSYAGTIANWLGITFSSSSSNPMYYVKKCFENGSTEVNALVIPEKTTAIGNYAFYNCSGLTSVTLPAELTSVGTAAFSTCTNIANTNFLGNIDQWCGITFAANIANPAFFSKQLSINGVEQTDIYLSDDLTEVKDYVFEDNRALERVSIKNTTTINSKAFKDCAADIVVRGELSADFGTGLHWSLLDGVLTISKISGTGVMPDYSTSTTAPWYPYRKSVSKIVIEEGVTQIGKYSFQSFTGSTGVYLPSTLATINDYAFYQATGISYIVSKATTPPTVIDSQTGYSSGAIYDSNAFTGIPTTILVYVPSGSESSYSTAVTSSHSKDTGWKRFSSFVPCVTFSGTCGATGNEENVTWEYDPADKSLTIFGTGAMADYASSDSNRAPWYKLRANITSIDIGNSITNIGSYAFNGCNNVGFTNIAIPASIDTIGSSAFSSCSNLHIVNYLGEDANGWASIGFQGLTANPVYYAQGLQINGIPLTTCTLSVPVKQYAFYNDTLLTSVITTAGCTYIGKDAFQGGKMTSVTIGNSVKWIGYEAFYNCKKLGSVSFENNSTLDSIANWAFQNCSTLTSITIPEKVRKFNGSQVFSGCANLQNITWNAKHCNDFTSGNGPFNSIKTNITSFTFGETVDTIPDYLCQGMNNVAFTSITIPAAVKSIGANTFIGCTNITSVTTNALTPPTIQSTTFPSSVESAATLYVPATVASRTAYTNNTYWREFAHMLPYIISFNMKDHGDAIDPICVNAGRVDVALKPADPTEDYYTFGGWYVNADCTIPFTFGDLGTTVDKDTTLYAKWTIYNYQVTFDLQGHGDAIDPQTINHGELASEPSPAPTAVGYTFGGWYKEAGCSNAWNFSTDKVTDALVLYAKWTINSYDVTFDLQGHGDPIAAQSIDYNGTVSEPSAPSEDYYTFGGWYKEAGCSTAWDFSEDKVTDDLTLYAKWTLNGLALDEENEDNDDLIAAYDDQTTNVTMVRSLTNAQYNTFCLPFALSNAQLEETFGAGYDLEEFISSSLEGDQLSLTFERKYALEAGKPYLLQPKNSVADPSFEGVTIAAASPADQESDTYISFHAVYSPTELQGGNHNLLFLGAGNELFWPASTGDLKGFRAYFEVKGAAQKAAKRARIVKKEDTATGIGIVESQKSKVESIKVIRDGQLFILRDGKTYNAQGMRVE